MEAMRLQITKNANKDAEMEAVKVQMAEMAKIINGIQQTASNIS